MAEEEYTGKAHDAVKDHTAGGGSGVKEFYEKHKVVVYVIGAGTVGLIGYSFLHGKKTSSNTPSLTSGAASPTQYLVPYTSGAGQPDSGSTGSGVSSSTTSTSRSSTTSGQTTTTTSPPSGSGSSSGSGAGSGGSGSSSPSRTSSPTPSGGSSTGSGTTGHSPTVPTSSSVYEGVKNFATAQQINRQSPGSVYYRNNNTGKVMRWNPSGGGAPAGSTLEVKTGSGASSGSGLKAIKNFGTAQQLNKQGGDVYYKAANGVFEKWNPSKGGAPAGSTLYEK